MGLGWRLVGQGEGLGGRGLGERRVRGGRWVWVDGFGEGDWLGKGEGFGEEV